MSNSINTDEFEKINLIEPIESNDLMSFNEYIEQFSDQTKKLCNLADNFTDTNKLINIYRDPSLQAEFVKNIMPRYKNKILTLPHDLKSDNIFPADKLLKLTEYVEKYSSEFKNKSQILDLNLDLNLSYDQTQINKPHIFFRMTNFKENHNNFQYMDGLCFDNNKFKPYGNCNGGGLYFTELKNIHQFSHYGHNIRPIIIPEQIPYFHESGLSTYDKYKAPVLFLCPKIELGSEMSIDLLYGTSKKNDELIIGSMYRSNKLEHLEKFEDYWRQSFEEKTHITRSHNKHSHVTLIHAKIKHMILTNTDKSNEELYNMLLENMELDLNIPQISPIKLNVSKLFFNFYNRSNSLFLKYLQTYFFPKLISDFNVLESNKTFVKFDYNTIIGNILDSLDNDFDYMLKLIVCQYDGLISGSYITKHISNKTFKSNDIDIYINSEHINNIATCLYNNRIRFTNSTKLYNMQGIKNIITIDDNKIEITKSSLAQKKYNEKITNKIKCLNNQYLSRMLTHIDFIKQFSPIMWPYIKSNDDLLTFAKEYNKHGLLLDLDCNTEFEPRIQITKKEAILNNISTNTKKLNCRPQVQIIFVDSDPWEFIKTQFDFDFCACALTSNNELLIAHPDINNFDTGSITDSYINKIIGSDKDLYSTYRAAKTIERSIKYIKRGFKITNLFDFMIEIKSALFDARN